MYASDYWSWDMDSEKMKKWIAYIREGVNNICESSGWPALTQEEIKGILCNNAISLYHIDLK